MANVEIPFTTAPPFRSHTVLAGVASLASSIATIFQNGRTEAMFVLTTASILARSSAEGNACALELVSPVGLSYGFLGGQTGAGVFDNFHWSGEMGVPPQWQIVVSPVGGQWDAIVSGYYTPLVLE